ncbi:MAG: Fatty acid desaturase [Ilumatobacteraceae bacterium]|jgi:acyl-[acyl-carrier-protein] desaturase|nr:Fatty acid desaturase [Ilumatobacteraceae bacterium]
MNECELLQELSPIAEQLAARHAATCKPWYPHEYVPWGLGRDFDRETGWDPEELAIPPAVRSALFVNLLTEDNLPYYFRTIDRMFGNTGVWREWSHRWTAEEARHSIALRDFMTVTRTIDPWALEDGRMAQMSGGVVPEPTSAVDGFVYVALQELATRIAHRNTGTALRTCLGDHPVGKAGYELINRVAADENFHYLFYRDLTSAALAMAPSLVLPAIERQVREFEMPGTGIPDFKQHASMIASAGLYNMRQHHDQILEPVVLNWWKVASVEGLDAEAEQAREAVVRRIGRIRAAVHRSTDRLASAAPAAV